MGILLISTKSRNTPILNSIRALSAQIGSYNSLWSQNRVFDPLTGEGRSAPMINRVRVGGHGGLEVWGTLATLKSYKNQNLKNLIFGVFRENKILVFWKLFFEILKKLETVPTKTIKYPSNVPSGQKVSTYIVDFLFFLPNVLISWIKIIF